MSICIKVQTQWIIYISAVAVLLNESCCFRVIESCIKEIKPCFCIVEISCVLDVVLFVYEAVLVGVSQETGKYMIKSAVP